MDSCSRPSQTTNAPLRPSVYEFFVIGEAAKNVPVEARATAPAVPRQVMSDMRNVVAHGYFGVDLSIVWQTATDDVPKLEPLLRRMLDS